MERELGAFIAASLYLGWCFAMLLKIRRSPESPE